MKLADLIGALKAAAEPNRLRLLSLCAAERASVSELAAVLQQSEPSVSRHLKQLESAGLVQRLRRGQRIYFHGTADGASAEFVSALRRMLGDEEIICRQDLLRLKQLRHAGLSTSGLVAESRMGRALAELMAPRLTDLSPGSAVCVTRLKFMDLLSPLLDRASKLILRVDTAQERGALQRWLGERGRDAVIEQRGALPDARSASQSGRWRRELVLSDCSALTREQLAEAIAEAQEQLAAGGVWCLCVNYDALDGAVSGEHPLMYLRRVLTAAGMRCERVQPVEVDGQHVLFSSVRALTALRQAAG